MEASIQCQVCGVETDKRCKGCQVATYCSVDCQASDWASGHQDECESIKEIGGRFGFRGFGMRGGGGFGGMRGGGGGLMRALTGGRGAFRGPVGTARLGLRGPGYSSRSLFRPVLGQRWGRGLGFGGYRWGYWGRWRFPWVYAYGLWYPWWFYLDPLYYRAGRPYVDPVTGMAYGVPPAPPGSWGPVGAPPQGMTGYSAPPGGGGNVMDPNAGFGDGQGIFAEIGAPLFGRLTDALGKGKGRGKRKFSRIAVKHTLAELEKGDLAATAAEWTALVAGVSGPVLRLLGAKKADALLLTLIQRHDAEIANAATVRSTVAVDWSAFWAVLSIDPIWLTLNVSSKSTLEEVIAAVPRASEARRVFLTDLQMHTALVSSYLRGLNNREECLDSARIMGENLDRYVFAEALVGEQTIEEIASMVYAELDAKK